MLERIVVVLMVIALVSGMYSAMERQQHECDFCIHTMEGAN